MNDRALVRPLHLSPPSCGGTRLAMTARGCAALLLVVFVAACDGAIESRAPRTGPSSIPHPTSPGATLPPPSATALIDEDFDDPGDVWAEENYRDGEYVIVNRGGSLGGSEWAAERFEEPHPSVEIEASLTMTAQGRAGIGCMTGESVNHLFFVTYQGYGMGQLDMESKEVQVIEEAVFDPHRAGMPIEFTATCAVDDGRVNLEMSVIDAQSMDASVNADGDALIGVSIFAEWGEKGTLVTVDRVRVSGVDR